MIHNLNRDLGMYPDKLLETDALPGQRFRFVDLHFIGAQ